MLVNFWSFYSEDSGRKTKAGILHMVIGRAYTINLQSLYGKSVLPIYYNCPIRNLVCFLSSISTGQKSYINFMQLTPSLLAADGSFLPVTTDEIIKWVSELGCQQKAPRTIKQYLSHVRSLHVNAGLPFDACESTIVQQVI